MSATNDYPRVLEVIPSHPAILARLQGGGNGRRSHSSSARRKFRRAVENSTRLPLPDDNHCPWSRAAGAWARDDDDDYSRAAGVWSQDDDDWSNGVGDWAWAGRAFSANSFRGAVHPVAEGVRGSGEQPGRTTAPIEPSTPTTQTTSSTESIRTPVEERVEIPVGLAGGIIAATPPSIPNVNTRSVPIQLSPEQQRERFKRFTDARTKQLLPTPYTETLEDQEARHARQRIRENTIQEEL